MCICSLHVSREQETDNKDKEHIRDQGQPKHTDVQSRSAKHRSLKQILQDLVAEDGDVQSIVKELKQLLPPTNQVRVVEPYYYVVYGQKVVFISTNTYHCERYCL